jgi:hypothetical protein
VKNSPDDERASVDQTDAVNSIIQIASTLMVRCPCLPVSVQIPSPGL